MKEIPGQTVISWWAETGMIEASDICMSRGENNASEDVELRKKLIILLLLHTKNTKEKKLTSSVQNLAS
jgi:hypothetical protein